MTGPGAALRGLCSKARIRERPEDFAVEELARYAPSGRGDHTFLWIEKRDRSTEAVAREIARRIGVGSREIGYAGRKDRRAVTRQWFSAPGLDPERSGELQLSGARILAAARHGHKLRTGQLRGNRFRILVRGLPSGVCGALRTQLAFLERRGMPNRFGPQRYGGDSGNAERGRRLLTTNRAPRDRRTARFLVSALQAETFDAILAARPLPLDVVEIGEIARVTASGGLFRVVDRFRENRRAQRFEISATAPLFGPRAEEPLGLPGERERALLKRLCADLPLAAMARFGARGGRRSVRARPWDCAVEAHPEGALLRFCLPAGSYASVLLEELLGSALRSD